MSRRKVRVDFGDERSWAEHVRDNVYRSLNTTFSNVLVDLPMDHEFAHRNGKTAQLVWGHLFRADVLRDGVVRPTAIIGEDLSEYPS